MRVPTLLLDDGDVLVDGHSILDYIESLAPTGRALFPTTEPDRHRAMKITALATGLSDKAVSLFYEMRLHDKVSDTWVERCRGQILGALAALEADRAGWQGEYWFGGRISHADIGVTCSLRHLGESHPGLAVMTKYPALAAHAQRLEAQPLFQAISQPFIAPS